MEFPFEFHFGSTLFLRDVKSYLNVGLQVDTRVVGPVLEEYCASGEEVLGNTI